MFYDKLKKVCFEKGTNMTALSQKLKISSGNISKWKNGVVPKSETLILIAQELSVSIDYLLGLNENSTAKGASALSKEKQNLLEMYDMLSEKEQGIILGELRNMTRERVEQMMYNAYATGNPKAIFIAARNENDEKTISERREKGVVDPEILEHIPTMSEE